eukprot:1157678-Pelagomonas_calceolata.AAC.2
MQSESGLQLSTAPIGDGDESAEPQAGSGSSAHQDPGSGALMCLYWQQIAPYTFAIDKACFYEWQSGFNVLFSFCRICYHCCHCIMHFPYSQPAAAVLRVCGVQAKVVSAGRIDTAEIAENGIQKDIRSTQMIDGGPRAKIHCNAVTVSIDRVVRIAARTRGAKRWCFCPAVMAWSCTTSC